MRNIRVGPVYIRLSNKNITPWGFPRVHIGGLAIWSWWNDGAFQPFSYHPRDSITWIWQTRLAKGRRLPTPGHTLKHNCGGQRDFWLPFGYYLSVHWQHRMPYPKPAN